MRGGLGHFASLLGGSDEPHYKLLPRKSRSECVSVRKNEQNGAGLRGY